MSRLASNLALVKSSKKYVYNTHNTNNYIKCYVCVIFSSVPIESESGKIDIVALNKGFFHIANSLKTKTHKKCSCKEFSSKINFFKTSSDDGLTYRTKNQSMF